MIFDRVFMGLRPTQKDENRAEEGLVGGYTYFVISTGAKRSGEICGLCVHNCGIPFTPPYSHSDVGNHKPPQRDRLF